MQTAQNKTKLEYIFFCVQWPMIKTVKQIRKYLLFQQERLKYCRLLIKGRIKVCRRNKSTERSGDLLTRGPRATRREQREGPSSSPAQYRSVLHPKMPTQDLCRQAQLTPQTSVGRISVDSYLRTLPGCLWAAKTLSRALEPL